MSELVARIRTLTLLQKFSLLSLGWMGATTIVGGAIAGRIAADSALRSEVGAYSEFLQAVDRSHGLGAALEEADPATRAARIAEAIQMLRDARDVMRIKVYDRQGTVVWSDEPRYNGLRLENRRLQRALGGHLAYELEVHRKEEHRFEPVDLGGLIKLYMPLRRGAAGDVLGAVEIYRDARPMLGHLESIRRTFWLIAVAGGLTIFLSMQVIVRRASARLRQAERELRDYSAGLEQKVQERTRELEAANLSLLLASQHKSEFLANMSHDIRTPLTSILGFAEILHEGIAGPLTDRQRRYAENILRSGQHLLALVNDVLDLSKVEAGRLELHRELIRLPVFLEDALALVRSPALRKHIALAVVTPEDVPPLQADPVRLRQILFNLLSNAIKFTPDGGTIRITARTLGGQEARGPSAGPASQLPGPPSEAWVEIAVTDTGVGIRPEDLGRLFREFTQLDTPATRRGEGTGLGLALCKRLVELHGGRIWAASEGEGKGSTFTFILPVETPSLPSHAVNEMVSR